jgi:hypothetical protein
LKIGRKNKESKKPIDKKKKECKPIDTIVLSDDEVDQVDQNKDDDEEEVTLATVNQKIDYFNGRVCYLSGYGTTLGPTIFVEKSSLSVVSRINQFTTTFD